MIETAKQGIAGGNAAGGVGLSCPDSARSPFGVPKALVEYVVQQFPLGQGGGWKPPTLHGLDHWLRVAENARRIVASEFSEEAGWLVPLTGLFALFHDSRRETEDYDERHGEEAALFLGRCWKKGWLPPEFSGEGIKGVILACQLHTTFYPEQLPTIANRRMQILLSVCLDADRLDLGRVGIIPNAKYLFTRTGKFLCPNPHEK